MRVVMSEEAWGSWEWDEYEHNASSLVRHRSMPDGGFESDYLGPDYLNALEAAKAEAEKQAYVFDKLAQENWATVLRREADLEAAKALVRRVALAAGPCEPYQMIGTTHCRHGHKPDYCPIAQALAATPTQAGEPS